MAYEDELATLMDEIMHLEHQLYGEKRKSRALERKTADCEEAVVEIQVLQQELIKEKKAKTALKIEVAKKDAELDMLQHQAAEREARKYAEVESLQEKHDNKQREKEALEGKIAELAQSNEALVKELDKEKCDNTALAKQVALSEANCAKKDSDLEMISERKTLETEVLANLEFILKAAKGVRIYVKQDPSYALTVRDGKVVLTLSNDNDLHQYWIKDDKYGGGVKDSYGSIGFALVNMATGQAMEPIEGIETCNSVKLVPYNGSAFNRSMLWSVGEDRGDNYRTIMKYTDTASKLGAFGTEFQDGNSVGLYKWQPGTNQLWKIVPQK